MSFFTYTNTITNGIPADGANVMTNFNDVRAGIIDGTKDININNITINNTSVSTVPYLDASKTIVSSLVTPTELALIHGLTSIKNITNFGATAWTPTGSWSTNTTYTGSYRRVGDMGQYIVNIALAGSPTTASLTVNLPAANTIDTTKLVSSGANPILGYATLKDTGNAFYVGNISYSSTTAVSVNVHDYTVHTGTAFVKFTSVNESTPVNWGSSDVLTLYFEVPIVEFA